MFEMMEDVRTKLYDRFGHGGQFKFVDISNYWTFSYDDGVEKYELFLPLLERMPICFTTIERISKSSSHDDSISSCDELFYFTFPLFIKTSGYQKSIMYNSYVKK